MTEILEQQQNSQLQSTPKWKQFPHESMQKLVPYLQGKVQSKDVLDHDLHSFDIMRHGKTANIDNEWDSQKDEHMGLSPSEFNFETSTIRTTAEEIVAMWYKKLKVYSPGDTLRNKQTKELLIQFVQQLNPEVQILEDPGFDANLHYFHARKQFTADVYQWLLAKDYLAPGERTMIEEYQGKKHVLGANRVIRLSKATQQQLQKDDPTLFAKVDGKYEESYSTIIDRAGQWVDALRKYVAAQDDKDALHLVVAYRTTLQATDQVMKSNKEVADMDSFFDTWFAQMQMSQCDDQGNSIHALTMNSRDYDPATYERDVSAFHAISPEIALEKSPYENMSLINSFLLQTEAFLEYCLSWPQPNKKILRRQNLLTRALKQPIPPVMARRIIETILNKYDTKDDKDGETKSCIDGILRAYIATTPQEPEPLLRLLFAYKKVIDIDEVIVEYFARWMNEIVVWLFTKEEMKKIAYYQSESNKLTNSRKREIEKQKMIKEFDEKISMLPPPIRKVGKVCVYADASYYGLHKIHLFFADWTKVTVKPWKNDYDYYIKEVELVLREYGLEAQEISLFQSLSSAQEYFDNKSD